MGKKKKKPSDLILDLEKLLLKEKRKHVTYEAGAQANGELSVPVL